MIIISTPVFDTRGRILIEEDQKDSNIRELERRFSKVKTIGTDVRIEDRGFSHGDRALRVITKKVTRELEAELAYIIETYSQVFVDSAEGTFDCLPARFVLEPEEAQLTFEVREKVSQ